MKGTLRCDPGAVLLFGIMIYSLEPLEIAALFAAAAVHEAGHVIALFAVGSPPHGILFTLSGPVILYHQTSSVREEVICSLSGPLFGLLFAFLFHQVWPLCAEISFLLSVINLLPVFPLDGGRTLHTVLAGGNSKLLNVLQHLVPVSFMLAGLMLIGHGRNGFGILMFGAWLLFLSCQEQHFDVK